MVICPFTNLNPLLHLEAVHVAVEDGGRGAVPDAGPQPHEEVDVVVVDAGRQLTILDFGRFFGPIFGPLCELVIWASCI